MPEKYSQLCPVLFGKNASRELGRIVAEHQFEKLLFVTDRGITELGLHLPLIEAARVSGVMPIVFDGCLPDPPDRVVNACGELARSEGVDAVVALGGGSSMDTAKAANLLIHNPGIIQNYFGVPKGLNYGVPLYCIPTTAGTGSEVAFAAVITNTETGRKSGMRCPQAAPTLAIIDPMLTITSPPSLTASCGFDAVAHAMEAITGKYRNPVSEALACNALARLSRWLPISVREPDNYEARENVSYAGVLAGMAFCNSPVHMGHSCGHTLGTMYHIPHGQALACVYPEVMECLVSYIPDKVSLALSAMGYDSGSGLSETALRTYAKSVLRDFVKSINMPSIRNLGIESRDTKRLAAACAGDFSVHSAPCIAPPDASVFESILSGAFEVTPEESKSLHSKQEGI